MELDEDQTEAMHFHIPRMDLVYLKHMSKKNANSQVLSQHSQKGQAV